MKNRRLLIIWFLFIMLAYAFDRAITIAQEWDESRTETRNKMSGASYRYSPK